MPKFVSGLVEGLASAAASRNYLSTLVGATGVVVALGVIDFDTAKGVVDAAQQIMDGLGQAVGGAKKMYVLLLPAATVVLAKYAGLAATLKGRLTSITEDPNVKIEGKITVPADVAAAVPSNQVVAKTAAALALLFGAGFILAMLGGAPSFAADLPPVAKLQAFPAPTPCTPTNCSGFYAGVNLAGVMTNANIIGNGINGSVAAGGQSIGIQAGYQFANGAFFFGPEVSANYIVNGNPNVTGGAPSRYRVGEYLKVGTALSNLISLGGSPTTAAPGIPAALANAVISPYVLFGAVQSGIGQGWATGAGVEFALAKNWFLDTRYTYINYGSASISPTEVAKSENLVTVGFNYKF